MLFPDFSPIHPHSTFRPAMGPNYLVIDLLCMRNAPFPEMGRFCDFSTGRGLYCGYLSKFFQDQCFLSLSGLCFSRKALQSWGAGKRLFFTLAAGEPLCASICICSSTLLQHAKLRVAENSCGGSWWSAWTTSFNRQEPDPSSFLLSSQRTAGVTTLTSTSWRPNEPCWTPRRLLLDPPEPTSCLSLPPRSDLYSVFRCRICTISHTLIGV